MLGIRCFCDSLTLDQLILALSSPAESLDAENAPGLPPAIELEVIGMAIDAAEVSDGLAKAGKLAAASNREDAKKRAPIDAEVLEHIHAPLAGLSHEAASNRGLWTWLACGPGRDFIWMRWTDLEETPTAQSAVDAALNAPGSDLVRRFRMTSPGLNGVSRHAIARLWWLCDSSAGDYEAAAKILGNQDVFQAIFEREIGVVPGLAPLLAEVFDLGTDDAPTGSDFRLKVMKTINQMASVTKIETLSPAEMRSLLEAIKEERLPS